MKTGWEKIFAIPISNERLYTEYTEISYNLNNKKPNKLVKMDKRFADTSQKKICSWPISTWKDAQHHQLQGKCKLKTNHSEGYPWWFSGRDFVLPLQGIWVWCLVGELRSRMLPCGQTRKKKIHNDRPLHTSLQFKIKQWQYQVLARMWSNWNSQRESKACKHFGKHFGHFKNQLSYIFTIWIIPGSLSKRKGNNVSIPRSVHKCSSSVIHNSSEQEAAQLFTDIEGMQWGAMLRWNANQGSRGMNYW